MINHNGRDYSLQDFKDAKDEDLESRKFYRVESEMEIGIAADLSSIGFLMRHAQGTSKL